MTFSSRLPVFLPALLLLACFTLPAQNSFQKIYGDAGSTVGNDVLLLDDSGYLVAGAVVGPVPGSPAHASLFRLDPDGAVLWQKSYPSGVDGVIERILPANDGGYLTVGFYRVGGFFERLMLLKTDLNGNLQWSRRFGFDGLSQNVRPVSDGYLICGSQSGDVVGGGLDGFFVKIDNDGEIVWTRTYGAPQHGIGFNDFEIEGDTLFTAGYYDMSCGFFALSLDSGTVYFAKKYSNQGGSGASLNRILRSEDGQFRVSGSTIYDAPYGTAPATIVQTIQHDGAVLSSHLLYGASESFSLREIQNTADGGFILCGNFKTGTDKRQSALLRSNAELSLIEAFQYSQDINLADFYQCLPTSDGGLLGLGAYVPLLNVQDTTVVTSMLLTKTRPDGLVEGCCIQPVGVKKADFPVAVDNLSLLSAEFAQTVQPLSLGTEPRALPFGDYCPHEPIRITDTLAFCPGDAVEVNGIFYDQPGMLSDTLFGTNACDTITALVLQWLPAPTKAQSIEFCPGESVIIGGVTYSQPGVVTDTLPAGFGCDTVATYTLSFIALPQPSVVSVQCPANQIVQVAPGVTSAVVTYAAPTVATDCPCGSAALSLVQGQQSGGSFPLGLTQVCYRAADDCGNSSSCCFNVIVEQTAAETACDTKITPCIKFEILAVFQNNHGQKTYRMRLTNTCQDPLNYAVFQLPDGLSADEPTNNSTYTAPSGRSYAVRNANASPFYSIRFRSNGPGIAGGQSDVFDYVLPPQADPDFIHAAVRLASGGFYETHLNVFDCPLQPIVNRPDASSTGREQARAGGSTSVVLYPNPAGNELFVDLSPWPEQDLRVQVLDGTGRLLTEQAAGGGSQAFRLDISGLNASGLYVVVVQAENGARSLGRFVKTAD